MSDAYLFWNLITAFFVSPPKYEVSLPGEPAPVDATCVSELVLSITWRFFTSEPDEPILRFVVNVADANAEVANANTATNPTNPAIDFLFIICLLITYTRA